MNLIFPILIIATVGLALCKTLQRAYLHPLAKVPGPWYGHLTHFRLKLAVLFGYRAQYIHSQHLRYGVIVRVAPNEVSIADPASFKEIHRIGTPFLKSDWYKTQCSGPLDAPPGIFQMTDPKMHAVRRKMFARGFSQNHIRDHWENIIYQWIELAVSRIREEMLCDGSSDILKWSTLMASDVSTQLMFGESFHNLERGIKAEYVEAIEKMGFANAFVVELRPLYYLGRLIPLQKFRSIFYSRTNVMALGQKALFTSKGHSSTKNIFAIITEKAEAGEGGLSDYDVVIEAGNLTTAGTDTTANTLAYLIWAILSRTDLQRQIEEEVAGIPMVDKELEKLPILNAAIEESLRLFCAVPGTLPRVSPPGGSTLCGYFLPEGTIVGTQAYTLHRHPSIFPDPERFDHTRWLGSEESLEAIKTVFHPFGAGARICTGIHLARMELRLAAAKFFQDCKGARLSPSTTPESMEMVNFFLMAPKSRKCEVMFDRVDGLLGSPDPRTLSTTFVGTR